MLMKNNSNSSGCLLPNIKKLRVMSPRWDTGHSWLCSPLKNNYSWTQPHCENSRTQGQGWSTLLGHRNQDKPRYEGKRSSCTLTTLPHTASPPYQCSTTKRGIPWACGSFSGKGEPRADIQLPHFVGGFLEALTLVSPQRNYRKICRLNHWESDCDGEREGLSTASPQIFTEQVPNCSTKPEMPTWGFLICRTKSEAQSD